MPLGVDFRGVAIKLGRWSEKWQKPIHWRNWWLFYYWVTSRLPLLKLLLLRLPGRREAPMHEASRIAANIAKLSNLLTSATLSAPCDKEDGGTWPSFGS